MKNSSLFSLQKAISKSRLSTYKNLDGSNDDILEIIGWINPTMKKLSEMYDNYEFLIDEKVRISEMLKNIDFNKENNK